MLGMFGAGTTRPGAADVVKDTTTAAFMQDVVEASKTVPVLVDFWATWCGPCKQLGPVIEKVVKSYAGRVKLVKLDTDKNPEIAQQMRIQSIPAVFAFFGGRPVDGFVGALPESQIKAFIDRLLEKSRGATDSPIDEALDAAREALAGGDSNTAGALYRRILQAEPENLEAISGLVRCLLALGKKTEAAQMLDQVPADRRNDKHVQAARAALDLANAGGDAGRIPELSERLAKDANDHQSRFDLALALIAANRREEAIDALLELFRRNREWNEQAARKQLVKVFEALGPTDPLTLSGRRRLSSLMFA
ncbi:MAG: thioredoxin [Alphaproteobacteria bacterium]|nr:thioredoxin [Alphaproteobacteria bacterium]